MERHHSDAVNKMIQDEIQRDSMISAGAYYNLDDEKQRDKLVGEGLIIRVGSEAHFMVKENASTGFGWIVDETSCFDEGLASYETQQGKTHIEAPRGGTNDGLGSMGARTQMVGMPAMRYYTLEGESEGSCEFRLFYARPWEFNIDDLVNSKYGRKIVIPLNILQ